MKSGIRLIDPTLHDIVLQDSQAAADDVFHLGLKLWLTNRYPAVFVMETDKPN